MINEVKSHLKNAIKDRAHQERALKLIDSAFSYIELDEKKQKVEARKKEMAKKKEAKERILKPKSKED